MAAETVARRSIAVSGVVQGVGFRPFVHGLAERLSLRGFVKNRMGGVLIEVEGDESALGRFVDELVARPPPLARIDELRFEAVPSLGDRGFRIEASEHGSPRSTPVARDTATCADCLREVLDPGDRRHMHAFANCTSCGPRWTIVLAAPYDRERTTMSGFEMCGACRHEYDDARDRRFHAQPIACPACGPRLSLLDARGARVISPDPVAGFARSLLAGEIGALKGLGGYHLSCDATDEGAVSELRRRKARDEKPFAIMVADVAAAETLCRVSAREREALESAEAPIVLLRRRERGTVAASVAPGSARLGVMLPYTPLHHLLMRELDRVPLVMTSANRSDEPIAFEDRDALTRLSGVADVFLVHDRPIHVRCEDSVVQVTHGAPMLLRRSRGYVPDSLDLPSGLERATLASGGHLKATFALGLGRRAYVSHHLGDLHELEAYRSYVAGVAHYERLFRIEPRRIVHDLHPDYASSRYARERAAREGLELVAVQHHHAHVASCIAENGVAGPVIGVAFDGAGYGTDGAIWGGEFLVGDCHAVRRAAHFAYVALPGGERAVREPWRMALAHLLAAGCDVGGLPLAARIGREPRRVVEQMIDRSLGSPPTSSVGRLFDAIASLVGVCDRATFEAQGAMRLEALARESDAGACVPGEAYPFDLAAEGDRLVVDVRPLLLEAARDVREGKGASTVSVRFHAALVEIIASVCARLREREGVGTVALTGGCFVNEVLLRGATDRLTAAGFRVYKQGRVPPNDGGLSLGQLAVCCARDRATRGDSSAVEG